MEKRRPLAGMRKTIAQRMRLSLDTAAQASHHVRVDMSALIKARAAYNAAHPEDKVSVTDILVSCTADALRRNPSLNVSLQEKEIVAYEEIHIGVAVAVENGLVVPVVRDCGGKSIPAIHSELRELVRRVREKRFTPADITGGTFTVTNLGMYGIDGFTAIINPPEAAILAVGATSRQPVVRDGDIVVRDVCELTLTYDHRVVDGAPAAQFLSDLRGIIENFSAVEQRPETGA